MKSQARERRARSPRLVRVRHLYTTVREPLQALAACSGGLASAKARSAQPVGSCKTRVHATFAFRPEGEGNHDGGYRDDRIRQENHHRELVLEGCLQVREPDPRGIALRA